MIGKFLCWLGFHSIEITALTPFEPGGLFKLRKIRVRCRRNCGQLDYIEDELA